jgi:hypothetical protein
MAIDGPCRLQPVERRHPQVDRRRFSGVSGCHRTSATLRANAACARTSVLPAGHRGTDRWDAPPSEHAFASPGQQGKGIVTPVSARPTTPKIQNALRGSVQGKRIAVLGLAFKPGTDDVRQAASIDVIRHLEDLGAKVIATDPAAVATARHLLPATELVHDVYACVRDADAVVVVTEWPEFRELDWGRVSRLVRRHMVVDGRNCLHADALTAAGFTYISMGRATRRPVTARAPQSASRVARPALSAGARG